MIRKVSVITLLVVLALFFVCCSGDKAKDTKADQKIGTEVNAGVAEAGKVVNQAADKVAEYIAKLDSDVDADRIEAVDKLKEMGENAETAVAGLTKRLQDDNVAEVRAKAADALGAIGSKAKSAVPDLTMALKDDSAEVRMESAKTLGLFKSDADSALVALKDAFSKETVVEVKAEMEKAINAIESDVKSMQEKEKTEDKPKG